MLDHIPVLLQEVIKYMTVVSNDTQVCKFLDCTFGAGGYSTGLMDSIDNSCVIAIDRDPHVKVYADRLSDQYGNRFKFIEGNFDSLELLTYKDGIINGVVFDLGVSSMQLDNAERGFSFQYDAPLDMRMSSDGISAYDVVNSYDEDDIANIIFRYGDEHMSRKIANEIVRRRSRNRIATTFELANIVRSVVPRRGKIDSATKTFQALRIAVNSELDALTIALRKATTRLSVGGIIAIVSFHSAEDIIVKEFFRLNSDKKVARSRYSKEQDERINALEILTKQVIVPDRLEIMRNPRSRSAKLRVARKVKDATVY